jgi:hypothetical protein
MFFDPIQIDDMRWRPSPNSVYSATFQRFFRRRFGIRRPKFTSLFVAKTPTLSQKSAGLKNYSIQEMQFRTLLQPITLRTVPILFRSIWVHEVVWWRAIRNYEIDQVITGNSVPDLLDGKHCLAVTGRSLNEHEDVDKEIFELVEIVEVREKSRRFIEEEFVKSLLQRTFMKDLERTRICREANLRNFRRCRSARKESLIY